MKTTEDEILSNGEQGPSGPGILSGAGVPTNSEIATAAPDGSFYLDSTVSDLYGPKTAGEWGLPTSLVAALTPVNLLAVIAAMDAAQLAALRLLLGIPTYNNLAAANPMLAQGDAYFDLARSRVATATN